MKSEYRQAIESVIAQEAKLAEVARLHADAAAREKQFSEALRFNQEALKQYERRVAELEAASVSSVTQSEPKEVPEGPRRLDRLESEIDELRGSLKQIAGWYLRGMKGAPPQV